MKLRTMILGAVALAVGIGVLRFLFGSSFDGAAGPVVVPGSGRTLIETSLQQLLLGGERSDDIDRVKLLLELDRLTVENAKLKHLEAENKELRETLKFENRTGHRIVQTSVLGHVVDSERKALLVDRGSDDGVIPGFIVTNGDGLVVGIVGETSARRSTIILITDDQSRVAVQIEGESRVPGVLEGGYGTGVRMRLIPSQAEVESGDVVVTSDIDSTIPSGLVVGQVESIRDEENIPFQVAVIRPSANIETPTTLSIVVPEV